MNIDLIASAQIRSKVNTENLCRVSFQHLQHQNDGRRNPFVNKVDSKYI